MYSFASAHFEMGDDATQGPNYVAPLGNISARPIKGLLGWIDDDTIIVNSSGKVGRWERFYMRKDEEGKRYCARDGWKRYLG